MRHENYRNSFELQNTGILIVINIVKDLNPANLE